MSQCGNRSIQTISINQPQLPLIAILGPRTTRASANTLFMAMLPSTEVVRFTWDCLYKYDEIWHFDNNIHLIISIILEISIFTWDFIYDDINMNFGGCDRMVASWVSHINCECPFCQEKNTRKLSSIPTL